MCDELIALSVLELDLDRPAIGGWHSHLGRLGVAVVQDDLGRDSISRDAARELFTEQREQRELADRKREEIDRQAVERDQAFRAGLGGGIPADAVPAGMTAGMLMMASDPELQRPRRESVLDHALSREEGLTYHPIRDES
jgi:hypothetical protein